MIASSRLPLRLAAAVAVADADGRVLFSRRPTGRPMSGYWELPGGKARPDEAPEDAAARELREEVGLDLSTSCLAPLTFVSHAYDDFHLLMPVFICRRWEGVPRPLEGQTLEWAFPRDMLREKETRPLLPSNASLLATLRDVL